MRTLHETKTIINKQGISITRNTYCEYNHKLKRNVFKTSYYATLNNTTKRGNTKKEAISKVLSFNKNYLKK